MRFRPTSVRRRVRYVTTAEVAALLARDERLRAAAAAADAPDPKPQTTDTKPSPSHDS